MLTTALQRRKRALTAWHAAKARGTPIDIRTSQKFALFVLALTPIIYIVLLASGAMLTMVYVMMGSASLLSAIDLGGFLFMLLAYGVWFTMNTRYREVTPAELAAVTVASGEG